MASRRSHELAVVALAALTVAAALTLGRVFDGAGFALPVVGAALLPHALSAITRARGWSAAASIVASLVAMLVYIMWVVDPGATWYGVPTAETFEAFGRHVRDGYDELRTAVVPAPVTDGALVLAVAATWLVAETADVLAFRRDACVAAIAPALALFIWAATLGADHLRARTTIGFAAAAVVFLLCQHQALLERNRAWFQGRRLATGTGLTTAGVIAGVLAVVGGAVVGPALPGAESDALIDVKGLGNGRDGGGPATSYQTEPPLARIGANFVDRPQADVFTVGSAVAEYWRIAALDQYSSDDGGQWTLTAEGPDEVAEGLVETERRSDVLRQDFRIGALDGRWMPAAYRAVAVDGVDPLVVTASTTLVTGRETVSGLQYTVLSQVPTRADVPLARRAAPDDQPPPPSLREYTELPGDFPQDVRGLADEVVAGAANPYERALALEAFYLAPEEGFVYDLGVDLGPAAQSQSAIRRFLLSEGGRRGFCVQFAGSYAAMARAVGLPARVAVGYTPGTRDPSTRLFRVTTWNAHAWPEVWLAGAGWVRFEPTPASPDGRGGSVATGDAAVPGGNDTTASPTPTSQPAPAPSSVPGNPPAAGGEGPSIDVSIDAPGRGDDGGLISISPFVLVVAAVVVAAAVAGAAAAVVVAKRRRRAHRRTRLDATDAIAGAWEETLERLREAGVAPAPALTPLELASGKQPSVPEAAVVPLRSLAETYTAARYGTATAAPTDAARAWTHVDEIDRALADDASVLIRWRRRLDPTSLQR